MPQLHMTWVPARKGWMKYYRGRMYSRSCKQLKVPATKKESWQAANAWWEAKLAGKQPKTLQEATRDQLERKVSPEPLFGFHPDSEGTYASDNPPLEVEPLEPAIGLDAIGPQIERWLKFHKVKAKAGGLSTSTVMGYEDKIGVFQKWIGATTPLTAITTQKVEDYYLWLLGDDHKKWRPAYTHDLFGVAKNFIFWLAEKELIELPKILLFKRLKIGIPKRKIQTFTIEEVRATLQAAKEKKPRLYLWLLLMLNCGMYANDVAELSEDEVDWSRGEITRPRSKQPDGPVVTYKLWPETFELLKEYRTEAKVEGPRGNRALLTSVDKPLVVADKRIDNIRSAYRHLLTTNKELVEKPLKLLRKTSATQLEDSEQHFSLTSYFLAHSPRTMAEIHYAPPSQKRFFAALAWLRKRILGG